MNDKKILSRLEALDNTHNAIFFGRNILVVFARAPIPGEVKSRLAKHIGNDPAARIYIAMLRDCLELAQNAAIENTVALVCYTPSDAFTCSANALSQYWNGQNIPQSSGDLTDRLTACFSDLKNCGAEKIVVIGSDAPDIPVEYLRSAFDILDTNNLVFGPAEDGGFLPYRRAGNFYRTVRQYRVEQHDHNDDDSKQCIAPKPDYCPTRPLARCGRDRRFAGAGGATSV